MSSTNLNLDASKIEELLITLDGCSCKKESATDSRELYSILRKRDGANPKIMVHHINGGKTTLQLQGSPKYSEFGKEIIQLIIEKTKITSLNSINDTIIVDISDFEELIVMLGEKENITKKEIVGGIEYTYHGQLKEKFTFKYFNKRNNLQLIGNPLNFFMKIILILDDLGYEASKGIIEKAVNIEIPYNDLWELYLPNTKSKLSVTVQKVIEPSMIFVKVSIPVSDYSYMLHPALRGMESAMRKLLEDYGVEVNEDRFQIFTKSNGRYILHIDYWVKVNDAMIRTKLEDCYNFYNKHRHTLFHASDEPSEVRYIESRNEALELLFESFNLMEELHGTV